MAKQKHLELRDVLYSQTNILGRRISQGIVVDSAGFKYKVDESGHPTTEIEYCMVDIIATKGKVQTVKLPISTKETVEEIQDALHHNKTVTVHFGQPKSTLCGRGYAIYNEEKQTLYSGVSASATEINIVKIEEPEFDDFDVDVDF